MEIDPFIFRLSIFILSIFIGYFVVWSVTPSLHTPLMSVTNAISSVIIVGAIIASFSSLDGSSISFSNILGFFAVGIVDEKKILNKKKIKKNDLVLAVPSSGLHSNGYSLVRYVLKKKRINLKNNKFLKNELLKPTKIYVKEVLNLINNNLINGCANITGGGLADNIKRVIPDKMVAEINLNKVKTKKIFKWLKENNIKDEEMLKTFNCGVGFCLIINPKNLTKVKNFFTSEFKPYIIGKIVSGKNKVRLDGKIDWS